MAYSKFLLLIILCLSLTSVQPIQQECPCNPMKETSGRCSCYICLDHKKWKSTARNLTKNSLGNKLYAPSKYLCPDGRDGGWENIEFYAWITSPAPQGIGYQPGAIVYEIQKLRKPNREIVKKWESSYRKAIRNGYAPIPNPCKRSITRIFSNRNPKTYAVCWYQVAVSNTTSKIEQANAAKHIKQENKDIIGVFFFVPLNLNSL